MKKTFRNGALIGNDGILAALRGGISTTHYPLTSAIYNVCKAIKPIQLEYMDTVKSLKERVSDSEIDKYSLDFANAESEIEFEPIKRSLIDDAEKQRAIGKATLEVSNIFFQMLIDIGIIVE